MSPPRRHPSKYPRELIVKFSKIINEERSAFYLEDFQSSKPSFFTLAEPLVNALAPVFVTSADSFFFVYQKGVTFSDKLADSRFPARLIWAAFSALQRGFAPLLTSMDNANGSFDFAGHASLMDGLFEKLETNLVGLIFLFPLCSSLLTLTSLTFYHSLSLPHFTLVSTVARSS
jgi:hypothetical protein